MPYNYSQNFGGNALEASTFRVTAVAAPLVTLAELKLHLGIYEDDFDTMLSTVVIPAATEITSNYMGEFATATTVQAFYPQLGDNYVLPHNHVASITSIQYYDAQHMLTPLMAGTDFIFDTTSSPSYVTIINDSLDIELSDRFQNPIVITYSADISDAVFDVSAVVQATLMIAADLWYNRSNQTTAWSSANITAERILAPLKRVSI